MIVDKLVIVRSHDGKESSNIVKTFKFSHRQGSNTSLEPSTATLDITADQILACAKVADKASCHSQSAFGALPHKS